jgi:hypothetical protein
LNFKAAFSQIYLHPFIVFLPRFDSAKSDSRQATPIMLKSTLSTNITGPLSASINLYQPLSTLIASGHATAGFHLHQNALFSHVRSFGKRMFQNVQNVLF